MKLRELPKLRIGPPCQKKNDCRSVQSYTLSGRGTIFPMLSDWIELCRSFNDHRVEYLLVGGQAVIAHGYPRLTKDMDLWVRPSTDNGVRVLAALADFGTPMPEFGPERFTDPNTLLMLGSNPFRVDILTEIPGVEFGLGATIFGDS